MTSVASSLIPFQHSAFQLFWNSFFLKWMMLYLKVHEYICCFLCLACVCYLFFWVTITYIVDLNKKIPWSNLRRLFLLSVIPKCNPCLFLVIVSLQVSLMIPTSCTYTTAVPGLCICDPQNMVAVMLVLCHYIEDILFLCMHVSVSNHSLWEKPVAVL